MKKILYIVLDGLGDRPCREFNGKTPLESANTPNLDKLANEGKLGFVHTVGEGIAPESDIAVISILGYDALRYYTGRGPLESYAAGLEVNDGDLAHRANFATMGEDRKIIDRRVGRNLTTEEATELAETINSEVKLTSYRASFKFKNTVGHRAVLVFHPDEGKLSGEVTNTDPAYAREGVFGVAKASFESKVLDCAPLPDCKDPEGARNSCLLTNEFTKKSHEVMENHPVNLKRKKEGKLLANLILTRDAGDRLPEFPPLKDLYGVEFASFVEMPVERGIAILTGMEIIELPVPSGELSTDYTKRAEMVVEAKDRFDGLYIHIKGPDEPAHDGDAHGKKDIIEKIDRYFFGSLLASIDMDKTLIAVTADHSTPCSLKAHSDDPVPLLVWGGKIESDKCSSFSEVQAKEGSLGKISGPELLPLFVKLA